jgi:O-methyltransferase involved in polyketide biosynthesis
MQRDPNTDPVSSSGRIIAAWRALESAEPDPLFVDPLAADLAGAAAVAEAERLARPWPPGAGGGRRYCIANVGARVSWFDRHLEAALAGKPLGDGGSVGSSTATAAAASPPPPRQVVILGAGYDTRPWRLQLPAGVAWFEVDVPEVVAAKRRQLAALGAGFDRSKAAGARHALRAASWTGLSADLGRPGVVAALVAAGFDVGQPTVWVAEGLLMYLTEQQTDDLLEEAAGECNGSRWLPRLAFGPCVINLLHPPGCTQRLPTHARQTHTTLLKKQAPQRPAASSSPTTAPRS